MGTSYKSSIYDNPFRILGVYANASIKDIKANEAKAKAFLNVGKEVSYPCDFTHLLPPVQRTTELIATANSKLTLPSEKVKYTLFWFVKVTALDEIAFNHYTNGNVEYAIAIWKKKECFSSLLNLSTLSLIQGNVSKAVESMNILFETDTYRQDLVTAVTDNTFQISKEDLIHIYLDELIPDFAYTLLDNTIVPTEYKEYIRERVVAPIIKNIESEVSKAKAIEHEKSTNRYNAGIKLMALSERQLDVLKKLLVGNEMRYQIIADKLGLEILQCGIDYYNNSDDTDAAHKAMRMQNYAQSIVIGQIAKDRCKQNTDILKKIIAELPPLEVLDEDKQIKKALALFYLLPNNIENSNILMKNCAPYIIRIKEVLGSNHQYLLKISTLIVQVVLNNVIEEVNQAIDDVNEKRKHIWEIKPTLMNAWRATLNMEQFGMEASFEKERFISQKNAIIQILSSARIALSLIKAEIDLRTEEERYKSCKTIDDYEEYLKDYPNGQYVKQAKQNKDTLFFKSCKSKTDFQRYIRLHPNGIYLTSAKEKVAEFQRIEDEKKKQESDMFHSCSSIIDFKNYISKYPHGMYLDEANERIRKMELRRNFILWILIIGVALTAIIYLSKDRDIKAFNTLLNKPTIEKCQDFIERYPQSIKVNEVKRLIEKQYEVELLEARDSASLANFINKYSFEFKYAKPIYKEEYKSKYIEMARKSLKAETERLNKEREERRKQEMKEWSTESKAWKKAIQSNTMEYYNKYLSLYPNGTHSAQAKQKIIDLEVSDVFASGNYGQLPSMDRTGYSNSTYSTVSVRNDTQYTLTLRYSGVESKKIVISPHSSRSVQLKSGSYRIVASVNASNVRNFAGHEELTGGSYDVSYYIQTSRY